MKLLPYDKEDELQKHFNGTKLIGDFNGTAPSSSGFDRCRQSMPCRITFLFRMTSLAAALLTPERNTSWPLLALPRAVIVNWKLGRNLSAGKPAETPCF